MWRHGETRLVRRFSHSKNEKEAGNDKAHVHATARELLSIFGFIFISIKDAIIDYVCIGQFLSS
jgi:hypothetical protein